MSLIKVKQKGENEFKKYIFGIPFSSYQNKGEEIIKRTFFQLLKKKKLPTHTKYYLFGIQIFSKKKALKSALYGMNSQNACRSESINPDKDKLICFNSGLYQEKKSYYNNLIEEIVNKIKTFNNSDIDFTNTGKIKLEDYSKEISRLDPLGCIIKKGDKIYRGVYPKSVEFFKKLYRKGILQVLSDYGLIVETTLTDYYTEDFPLILEHKKISCISPQFWSYTKFKDVAINQSIILKVLNEFGYSLIDGHCGNSGFDNNKVKQVDIGSIIECDHINEWALNEIISDQLFSLMMKSLNSGFAYKVQNVLRRHYICNEVYLINSIEFNFILGEFRKLCDSETNKILDKIFINRIIEPEDVDVVFNFKKAFTMWSDYMLWTPEKVKAAEKSSDNRFYRLCELINQYSPDANSSLDLAGNSGYLSAMISEYTNIKQLCSVDYDESAIEYGLTIFKNNYTHINLGLINFMLPLKPAYDEFRSDIVVAQAITHHLILTQKYNIDAIFEIMKKYSNKYVYIEFCPLGMYAVGDKTLPEVPEWYTVDWFEENFKKYFELLHRETIGITDVCGTKYDHRILFIGKILN